MDCLSELFYSISFNFFQNMLFFISSILSGKMKLEYLDARMLTESNARIINMNMSNLPEVPENDEEVVQLIDHQSKVKNKEGLNFIYFNYLRI